MSQLSIIRDTSTSSPVATSERRFSAPFDGDITQYIHEQDFIQDRDKFKPLQISTPDSPDYPASFLIEETPPQNAGPGLLAWTRIYSRIPSRRLDGESYSWALPGIAVEAAYNSTTVDNSLSFNVGSSRTRITTTAAHELEVGHFVQIVFTATLGDIQQTLSVNRTVLSVLSFLVFEVDIVIEQDPTYQLVTRVDGGREPGSRVVPSLLQYDYYLPGVPGQVKAMQQIPIIQALVIRDNTGKETNTFSLETSPTKAQWLSDVAAHRLVVPEASVIRRWKGNIFERLTRFVYAT